MVSPLQFPHTRHVILYYANCADGFCANYLLQKYFRSKPVNEFSDIYSIPVQYGEPVPSGLKTTDIVYLLDFSFKRDVMIGLCNKVQHVFVLDHHKTAKEELTGLQLTEIDNVTIFFDVSRSGALMTHDFIQSLATDTFGEGYLPIATIDPSKLVRYVEDRDLWRFELPYSREINAYIRSLGFSYPIWRTLEACLDSPKEFTLCAGEGAAILRFQQIQINQAVSVASHINFPLGPRSQHSRLVPIVNTTVNHSEVGEKLCNKSALLFAVTWFQRQDGKFVYSLRSKQGYDVSKIAKAYGGGGHLAAAGFVSDTLIQGLE